MDRVLDPDERSHDPFAPRMGVQPVPRAVHRIKEYCADFLSVMFVERATCGQRGRDIRIVPTAGTRPSNTKATRTIFTTGTCSHEGHVDEHVLGAGKMNPAGCTPPDAATGHAASHTHDGTCGHSAVPHGDHVDCVVNGHLHHPHDKHCDDHGAVQLARN